MGQEKNQKLRQQRAQQKRRKQFMIGGAAVLATVVLAAGVWLLLPGSPDNWDALVEEGRPIMNEQLERPEHQGERHVASGTRVAYDTDFPTSGPHWPSPTRPGFYTQPQPNEALVHAIEHGNIVVYYDQLSEEDLATLQGWTSFYTSNWAAVTAVPHSGLDERVVMTAWGHRLRLDGFDPAPMAAFIEAYRGRGPENPVR